MAMQPTGPIDDYIADFPPDVQRLLQKLREVIRKAAPAAEETIKYRIPTFVLHGNLVHFAGFKNHIGFYPAPSAITAFANELASYANAKGSVQFPLGQPLPTDLIRRMVEFRVKEATAKAARPKANPAKQKSKAVKRAVKKPRKPGASIG